jgi:hypothetical protein
MLIEFRVNRNGVKVRGLREELYEKVEGDVKFATRYWLYRVNFRNGRLILRERY